VIQKILLGLTAATILLSGCGRQNFTDSILQVPAVNPVYAGETEPNYISTLNDQGTQLPDINNIFRFGKVNNKLYRGGLPTDSDLLALRNFRIKTIVSFRGLGDPTEPAQVAAEKAAVENLGMKFVNIQVPFDKPVPDKTINAFFNTVNNPQNQPLFVHCKGGRDRTGTMVAFYRIKFEGFLPEQALKEMQSYAFVPTDYPIFTNQLLGFRPGS
jgi:protein tyrosine/serine phosphatase